MTNKLEQDKQIIADASELSVGVNKNGHYTFHAKGLRSLDDIRENIALQERIAELEKLNKTLETLMKSGERRGVEKATEELSQTLTQKDKKIAELEKKSFRLECENEDIKSELMLHGKAINAVDEAFVSWGMAFYIERPKESIQALIKHEHNVARDSRVCREAAIFALEQQAKGIEWVLACRELNLSQGEVHTMMNKCNKLREQAKGGDL